MSDKAPGAAELLPCPFCGGAARIESNRDWHRLYADHDEECVFDADDHALMFPAQPGYLLDIALLWNRRAALKAQPAPTEAQDEDSARLDALASEIEGMAPAHDRGCFGKRSDFDHYAEGHEYARKAAAARIREFSAAPQPQEQS
jgi:hypothetical protein